MIPGRTVLCLALAQLIAWGTTHYLIGMFGDRIAADLGWRSETVHGGFAAALLVMGVASPLVGRFIDHRGGRAAMSAGALLTAAGCLGLSVCASLPGYYAAWACLGVAMRLTLYDAAFATLARIGGPQARRPMSQITLLGGLASTTFWPVGHALADHFGWRGAVAAYAGFALLTIPLYRVLPAGPAVVTIGAGIAGPPPLATGRREVVVLGGLFAVITGLANFLNAGMSAHMIGILAGLGLGASTAVWIAALRGVGQSLARALEVLFGTGIDPLALNLLATLLSSLAFAVGLLSGVSTPAAVCFGFVYGLGNGLLTITRGTLPLILFDHRRYGAVAGRLIAPGFVLSAAAPVVYALVIERFGEVGALRLSAALAVLAFTAAALLRRLCGRCCRRGEAAGT